MSMKPEQENFDNLRRLLALKRHEQPPPGYFESFSGQIIARIQAGEASASWLERLFDEAPWVQRFWDLLGAKPVLASGFGLAICGVLVAGLVLSEDTSVPTSTMAVLPGTDQTPVVTVQPDAPVVSQAMPGSFSSTSGVLPQGSPSIFQEFKEAQRPLFQRVDQTVVVQH